MYQACFIYVPSLNPWYNPVKEDYYHFILEMRKLRVQDVKCDTWVVGKPDSIPMLNTHSKPCFTWNKLSKGRTYEAFRSGVDIWYTMTKMSVICFIFQHMQYNAVVRAVPSTPAVTWHRLHTAGVGCEQSNQQPHSPETPVTFIHDNTRGSGN